MCDLQIELLPYDREVCTNHTCLCIHTHKIEVNSQESYLWVLQDPFNAIDKVREKLGPLCIVEQGPSNRGDLH